MYRQFVKEQYKTSKIKSLPNKHRMAAVAKLWHAKNSKKNHTSKKKHTSHEQHLSCRCKKSKY